MSATWKLRVTVQPGGKIEVNAPGLPVGQAVEVLITSLDIPEQRSALQVLESAPGQRLFKTAAEVDDHIRSERGAWER